MGFEVEVETILEAPGERVGAIVGDPRNAPMWHRDIVAVRAAGDDAPAEGAELTIVIARGDRHEDYEARVVARSEGLLSVEVAGAAFPLVTEYRWDEVSPGRTRVRVRTTGRPRGAARLGAPLVAPTLRRSGERDLEALRAIVEA
ncbi:MAG: SRPBCC family protein [Miltoncostaeaceae bacterium]